MARKRSLDPGIWTSDQFIGLTHRQRLMFIGLISNADDEGLLRGEAKKIKALIFPGDHIPISQIESDLQYLTFTKLIHRWQIDGEIYLELPSWHKYQKLNFKTESHLPKFKKGAKELLTKNFVSVSPQVRVVSKCSKSSKDKEKDGEEKISPPVDIEKCKKEVSQFLDKFSKPQKQIEKEIIEPLWNLYKQYFPNCQKCNYGVFVNIIRGKGYPYIPEDKIMEAIEGTHQDNKFKKLDDPWSRFLDRLMFPAKYAP